MISVQNVGSGATDVTVTITCTSGSSSGTSATLSKTALPAGASVTWALKDTTPTGLSSSSQCNGSAKVTSTSQPIVAVNSENAPAIGNTNTFEGLANGAETLYLASLSNGFYGWVSSVTVVKLSAGNTTVTIDYGNSKWTDDTCNLTDAVPSCQKFLPASQGSVQTSQTDRNTSATITSNNSAELLAVAGSSFGALSNGVNAFQGGSSEVALPNVARNYYGYVSFISCQNLSATPTTLNVGYSGSVVGAGAFTSVPYNTNSLNQGDVFQVFTPTDSAIPDKFNGGATIKANAVGAQIACQMGTSYTLAGSLPGDWADEFTGFSK
jgi:hypothetical protein